MSQNYVYEFTTDFNGVQNEIPTHKQSKKWTIQVKIITHYSAYESFCCKIHTKSFMMIFFYLMLVANK